MTILRSRSLWGLLLAGCLALASVWILQRPVSRQPDLLPPLTELVDCRQPGYAQVEPAYSYRFPQDHAAHEAFCSELWSLSGELVSQEPEPRRFGFQFGIIRLALSPERPDIDSAWATNQFYRAHFALADVAMKKVSAYERVSRAALDLAGSSRASSARVWVENWSLAVDGSATQPWWHLTVKQDAMELTLSLPAIKPVVTANASNSFAAAATANPFHAYLLPRLQAQGELVLDGKTLSVRGHAWLNRAWGQVPAGQGQLVLNRFSLQLNNDTELLILQLRRRDGSGIPINNGLLIGSDNRVVRLPRRAISLLSQRRWTSPQTGYTYPLQWHLQIAKPQLDLQLTPSFDAQELPLSMPYWSGLINVSGEMNAKTVAGIGQVELNPLGQPQESSGDY